MISTSVSRRALAKGAAWSLPAVAMASAVPAMAASNQEDLQYYAAKSVDGFFRRTGCDLYDFSLTTENPVGVEQPGFSVGYTEGAAEDTTATLSSLQFVMAVPKGMLDAPTIDNDAWAQSGPTGATSLVGRQGANFNTSNYDVYVYTFSGPMTNPVVVESQTESWPQTTFNITDTSGTMCSGSPTIYAGYRGEFTTANGTDNPFNSIEGKSWVAR